jgi:imidazole glycerol phosphate synthase subunit HisF
MYIFFIVPIIACGGAGMMSDFREVIIEDQASSVAAGRFFVYQGEKDLC